MNKPSAEDAFLKEIAAIFEENCLHNVKNQKEIEFALIIAINYCLDHYEKIKKSAE